MKFTVPYFDESEFKSDFRFNEYFPRENLFDVIVYDEDIIMQKCLPMAISLRVIIKRSLGDSKVKSPLQDIPISRFKVHPHSKSISSEKLSNIQTTVQSFSSLIFRYIS